MKTKHRLFYLLTAGFFFIAGLFWLALKEEENRPNQGETQAANQTYSTQVPKKVAFCGEQLVLDRYDLHERFDREMNAFIYWHSTGLLLIKRANRYFPILEPILAAHRIPDDFKYLAVIESSLNTRALSPSGAAGLWQLMPQTAKEYGLEVNEQVDERYHLKKATEAACRYLQKAYRELGSWYDVAAAYNAGMSRIKTELIKQEVNSFSDLLLVEETSRYLFRILAAKEFFSHPKQYGFRLKATDLYPPIRTQQLAVSEDIESWAAFAREQGINYYLLKEFNVWLRDRGLKTKGKTYYIDLPNKEDLYYSSRNSTVHNKNWIVD